MSLTIGVQLTTRCNLNCTHCFVDSSGNDISLENLEKIISFAQDHHCSYLAFTGGEPTLHPRFLEIMNLLLRNDLKFTLVTNGWNFASFYRTIKTYLNNIKGFAFSLDGATESVHDLNRAKESYRRVLQAISICRSKAIPFGLRTTVTRRNINQLEEIALLAAKIGAEYWALMPLQPTPRTAALGLLLSPGDSNKVKEEASRLRKLFKMRIVLTAGYYDKDPLVLCPTLTMKDLFITSRGDVSFCCHLADYKDGAEDTDIIGNLERSNLYELHQHMVDTVATLMKEKIRRLAGGRFRELDYYPCWYCLKYFRKVDWMKELPDISWSRDLLDSTASQALTLVKK